MYRYLSPEINTTWNVFDQETMSMERDLNIPEIPKIPKELIYTKARTLIRAEKFEEVKERRSEKTINRELELYEKDLVRSRQTQTSSPFPSHKSSPSYSIPSQNISPIPTSIIPTADVAKAFEKTHRKHPPRQSKLKNQLTVNIPLIHKNDQNLFEANENTPILPTPTSNTSSSEPPLCGKDIAELSAVVGSTNPTNPTPSPTSKSQADKKLCFLLNTHPQTEEEYIQNSLTNDEQNLKLKRQCWDKWKFFVLTSKNKTKTEDILKQKIDSFMTRLKAHIEIQENILNNHNPTQKPPQNVKRKVVPSNPLKQETPHKEDNDLMNLSNKIAESVADTRHQLRSQSVNSLTPSLQGKAKLIRLITTVTKEPSPASCEPIHSPPPKPIILIEMDEKHQQRKQRLLENQNRKRLIEEAKDRIAREKYEQQIREEEREKIRKIKEFREKQRREREEMEKRKIEWARMKDLNELAVNHYNLTITKHVFQPWVRLLRHRQHQNTQAAQFNMKRIQRNAFSTWRTVHLKNENDKLMKALALRAKQLQRSVLTQWKSFCFTRKMKWQVAQDWSDLRIIRSSLQAWREFVWIEKSEMENKLEQAEEHYKRTLLGKCMQYWMILPQVLYLEREKQYRLQQWREKVQQVLPDFRASVDYNKGYS